MAAQIVSLHVDGKHNDRVTSHDHIDPLTSKDSFDLSLEEQFDANPFSDPKVAAHYRTIYEQARYECRGAFDPSLEWTHQEEKRIIRKLDWHVCTWAVGISSIYGISAHTDAPSASCSSPSKSTVAISVKLYPVTC